MIRPLFVLIPAFALGLAACGDSEGGGAGGGSTGGGGSGGGGAGATGGSGGGGAGATGGSGGAGAGAAGGMGGAGAAGGTGGAGAAGGTGGAGAAGGMGGAGAAGGMGGVGAAGGMGGVGAAGGMGGAGGGMNNAPMIVDYNPDHGESGDAIRILGVDLASGGTLTVEDENGLGATATDFGTATWEGVTVDVMLVTVPVGWVTGALTVTNNNGSDTGGTFVVGENLASLAGTTIVASSEYSSMWPKENANDDDLGTSWFTADGDCATDPMCSTVPFYELTFAVPTDVARVHVRGNREYPDGYDYIEGLVEVYDGGTMLYGASHMLPAPRRDIDVVFGSPLQAATSVKFTSVVDESIEPGLSEIEVFAP
jgi:hypothetical protein